MPLLETKGAASAQGFGLTTSSGGTPQYIEDNFSTYLHIGTGATLPINTGVGLISTSAWWVSTGGTTGGPNATAAKVAVDSSGNAYVVGTPYTGAGLLVKYNSAGAVQWQREFYYASGSFVVYSVAVDSSSNVVVCGGGSDGTRQTGVIAKYNSAGTLQWQRKLYTTNDAVSYLGPLLGVAVDPSANIYVCGYGVTTASGTGFGVLAKYNASGTLQWQREFAVSTDAQFGAVAVDDAGNVLVGGEGNNGNSIGVLVKYNTAGVLQWQRLFRGSTSAASVVKGIAVDSGKNAYIVANINDGTRGLFGIAKYDPSGVLQWQRKLYQGTSATAASPQAICTDASDNVYVVGRVAASLLFVAKYNSAGTLQWQRSVTIPTSANPPLAFGVAAGAGGSLYVVGRTFDATGTTGYFAVFALKQDGSTTSGYVAPLTMFAGEAVDQSGTAVDQALSGSSVTSSYVDAAGTITDTAGPRTFTLGAQAEVTSTGGLVWTKKRNGFTSHSLTDTARGVFDILSTENNLGESTNTDGLTNFTAAGFFLGALEQMNGSGQSFVSWTFKEQPGFFDVVTWTGNAAASRDISHGLGSVPGCVIVKCISGGGYNWMVWHRSGTQQNRYAGQFNLDVAYSDQGSSIWGTPISDPPNMTSTTFSIGSSNLVNQNGQTYVAYLFAHDPSSTGLIQCGSYVANDSANGPVVTLGWEPQWLLIKNASTTGGWLLLDTLRGASYSNTMPLFANVSDPEAPTTQYVKVSATGFQIATSGVQDINFPSGATFVYIAIRRGPMRTPTDATKVFAPVVGTAYDLPTVTGGIPTSFTVDSTWVGLASATSGSAYPVVTSRLTNDVYISTPSNGAEGSWSSVAKYDRQTGFGKTNFSGNIGWATQRAPKFFDVACYAGIGAQQTVYHGLNAVPELMILKKRSSGGIFTANWYVYAPALFGINTALLLNTSMAAIGDSSLVSVGASNFVVAASAPFSEANQTYIAQLWVTCPGVSKVGTYTGTGTTQTVNCGFTGGARFVLIKRTDSTGDWYVWDSAQGISSGNDPYILLNTGTNQTTGTNYVDAAATGFQITSSAPAAVNANGGTYLFLAIA